MVVSLTAPPTRTLGAPKGRLLFGAPPAAAIAPVIDVIVLAVLAWGDLRPGQACPYNILPWLTIALIAVGVIYALVLCALRPDALRRAPALLEGAEIADTDADPVVST